MPRGDSRWLPTSWLASTTDPACFARCGRSNAQEQRGQGAHEERERGCAQGNLRDPMALVMHHVAAEAIMHRFTLLAAVAAAAFAAGCFGTCLLYTSDAA